VRPGQRDAEQHGEKIARIPRRIDVPGGLSLDDRADGQFGQVLTISGGLFEGEPSRWAHATIRWCSGRRTFKSKTSPTNSGTASGRIVTAWKNSCCAIGGADSAEFVGHPACPCRSPRCMMWCMRRTNIYLDEEQTAVLDRLATQEGVSRAEVIRQLLGRVLASSDASLASDLDAIENSFGALRDVDVPMRGPGGREEHLARIAGR
jgi:hypothetical protein